MFERLEVCLVIAVFSKPSWLVDMVGGSNVRTMPQIRVAADPPISRYGPPREAYSEFFAIFRVLWPISFGELVLHCYTTDFGPRCLNRQPRHWPSKCVCDRPSGWSCVGVPRAQTLKFAQILGRKFLHNRFPSSHQCRRNLVFLTQCRSTMGPWMVQLWPNSALSQEAKFTDIHNFIFGENLCNST